MIDEGERLADDLVARSGAGAHDPFTTHRVAAEGAHREPVEGRVRWSSVPGDVDAARLLRLVAEGFAAGRHVDYVANVRPPARRARFRLRLPPGAVAPVVVPAPDCTVVTAEVRERDDGTGRRNELRIELEARSDAPIEFTSDPPPAAERWQVLGDDGRWEAAAEHEAAGTAGAFARREPVVHLAPTIEDGLWALPAPVLGRPVVTATARPALVTGESREEALAPEADGESRFDLVRRPDGTWTTEHELGFRFVRVDGAEVLDLRVEARHHPIPRRSAFACSDDRLVEIWRASAYTLRRCMHELMVDGIKRDRMPWSGDQALGTLANAYSAADGAIVEAGLRALGRSSGGYVNGIADYSLWWVITTGMLARHFDAGEHLRREADRIAAFVARLADDTDEHGLFVPDPGGDAFERPVFIDWTVTVAPGRNPTSLQLLWYWALVTAGEVLGSVGHPTAARWPALASSVAERLLATAWDAERGRWSEYVDGPAGHSDHALLFALLAAFPQPASSDPRAADRLAALVRGSTPFIAGFALEALGALGRPEQATVLLAEAWGAMLDAGARSFWEEFSGSGADALEMYGRPFGKSLCHAWSAGPAALLPRLVVGVRPVADGWARFVVEPALGGLDWAGAVVPVPQGEVVVRVDGAEVEVRVPSGCTLVRAEGDAVGPAVVRFTASAR